MRFAAVLLAAYSTVLVAELVGDKLLYTAASLAARFRAALVLPRAVAALSFGTLFLTEWGDPGQIAAAAIAAQTQLPLAVWVGGVLALMTKGAAAMLVGTKVRTWVPERALRMIAVATCSLMGLIALGEAILGPF